MLTYCQLDPKEHIPMKFYQKFKGFYSRKHIENKVCNIAAIVCKLEYVNNMHTVEQVGVRRLNQYKDAILPV